MRPSRILAGVIAALFAGVYAANASWLAPTPRGVPGVLAHRGVHQTFRRDGLTNDTCTATRIYPPTHQYLENTIPSMRASFAAGATAIEVDVHPTTDGEFAVFHDWTLECRTDGRGVTREQSMTYLRKLDVGYGYTADGGATFPFRGKGVGMMPTLHDVLTTFPGKSFLLNIKSRDPTESERLVTYLSARGHPLERLWAFAAGGSYDRLRQLAPKARVDSRERAKACIVRYLASGWFDHVPDACRGGTVFMPLNLRWAYWGWPNRFLARMARADAKVVMVGPYGGDEQLVSDVSQLNAIPSGFSGLVMTDHVEVIGPGLAASAKSK